MKFHSGNTMIADDVVRTFNRLKSNPDFKGIFAPFKEMKKVDDNTVDIVTDGPFTLVIHNSTYIFPLDSKFYEGKDEIVNHGDSFASKNISCTGPYTVASREQGVKVEFARNPNYWDKSSKGNVEKIVFTPIKEAQNAAAAKFQSCGRMKTGTLLPVTWSSLPEREGVT